MAVTASGSIRIDGSQLQMIKISQIFAVHFWHNNYCLEYQMRNYLGKLL